MPSDPLLFLRQATEAEPPQGVQARVAARLAASIATTVGSSAASALVDAHAVSRGDGPVQSSGGITRVLAERFLRWSLVPLGVGVALGAGGQALRGGGELSPQTATPIAPSATSSPPVVASVATVDAPTPEPRPEAQVAVPSSSTTKSTLALERSVLDQARRQLASDEPAKALRFLEEHGQRFPRGQLSEEREAMWINALALLGRGAEAKARGEAFAARFPNSLMGASVRAALLKVAGEK